MEAWEAWRLRSPRPNSASASYSARRPTGWAASRTYIDIEAYPFQIPLGSLIPVRVDNLLPANKNIGTTHITNGAYQLHPVEWSIGEAVGALIAFCLKADLPPRKIYLDERQLADYQHLLTYALGITLAWPDHIRRFTDPL